MDILLLLICLIAVFNFFQGRAEDKVVWIIVLACIIPPGVIVMGRQLFWLLAYTFIFSALLNVKWSNIINGFPLLKPFVFYFICMLVIGLADSRGTIIDRVSKPINFIAINSLLCIVTYAFLLKKVSYIKIYTRLIIFMVIVGLYGLYNLVTKTNPYNAGISQAYHLTDFTFNYMNSDDGRFRIASFMYHPFYLAIFTFFIVLFALFFYVEKVSLAINRTVLLGLLGLFSVVLLLTDSRTVQLLFVGGVIVYLFILAGNFKRSITISLLAPLLVAVVMQIPKVSDYVDKLTDVFVTGGEKVEGSNVNMRAEQLAISYVYFIKSPVLGNGFDYITESIGYASDRSKSRSDEDAYGFESYFYTLIIEQGLVGIIAHIVLFYSLIRYHIKNAFSANEISRKFIFISLLVVIGYVMFILATGTLNTMPMFFALTGISISMQQKLLQFKKSKTEKPAVT